jgi:hypothetical protein
MKRLPLILSIVSVCVAVAFAQEARQNVAPEKKPDPNAIEAAATVFVFHPIAAWTGKRFIFLPAPKASRQGNYEDFVGSVSRQKYAGRIARVVSVGEFSGRAHVEFEMEDTGERVRARTVVGKESVNGMALADDIENARKQWAGRTLWYRSMMISAYDEATDTVSMLPVKRYLPLKVLDVVAGWDEEKPVRFLLETADGKRGFLDMNLSGTNVRKDARFSGKFEEHMLGEDPRLKYKWPASVWKAIENSQIVAGMTAEQVKMSWGEPEKITRTAAGEQWTYPSGTLLFKNGVMTGRQ